MGSDLVERAARRQRQAAADFYYSESGKTGIVLDWIETGRDEDREVDDDVRELAAFLAKYERALHTAEPERADVATLERVAEHLRGLRAAVSEDIAMRDGVREAENIVALLLTEARAQPAAPTTEDTCTAQQHDEKNRGASESDAASAGTGGSRSSSMTSRLSNSSQPKTSTTSSACTAGRGDTFAIREPAPRVDLGNGPLEAAADGEVEGLLREAEDMAACRVDADAIAMRKLAAALRKALGELAAVDAQLGANAETRSDIIEALSAGEGAQRARAEKAEADLARERESSAKLLANLRVLESERQDVFEALQRAGAPTDNEHQWCLTHAERVDALAAKELKAHLAREREALEREQEKADSIAAQAIRETDRLRARAEKAEARLAEVEAERDTWKTSAERVHEHAVMDGASMVRKHAAEVRALKADLAREREAHATTSRRRDENSLSWAAEEKRRLESDRLRFKFVEERDAARDEVERLKAELSTLHDELQTFADEEFGPFPTEPCLELVRLIRKHTFERRKAEADRLRAQLEPVGKLDVEALGMIYAAATEEAGGFGVYHSAGIKAVAQAFARAMLTSEALTVAKAAMHEAVKAECVRRRHLDDPEAVGVWDAFVLAAGMRAALEHAGLHVAAEPVAAEPVADDRIEEMARECDRQRADEQRKVMLALGDITSRWGLNNAYPMTTDNFVEAARGAGQRLAESFHASVVGLDDPFTRAALNELDARLKRLEEPVAEGRACPWEERRDNIRAAIRMVHQANEPHSIAIHGVTIALEQLALAVDEIRRLGGGGR